MSDPLRNPQQGPGNPIEPAAFEPLGTGQATAPATSHRTRNLLLLALGIFLLAMLFLFIARPVQIVVNAESPAAIDVSGLVLPIGERYLMLSGEHRVTVEVPGYYPMATQLTIDGRDDQTYELTPQPLPGRLSINSTPDGATVLLDGQAIGTTPLVDHPASPGPHTLELRDARHLPLAQDIHVTGRDVAEQLTLTMSPAWAQLSLDSQPQGASILVDGEAVGTTPATVEVMQGPRQLMLQLPAYAQWQKELTVEAGTPIDLGRIALDSAPGWLELDSEPTGANVTLDGEFQGRTPLRLALTADTRHTLSLSRPGYARFEDTVSLPAEGSAEKIVKLQARLGEVRIRITPADAELWVSGRNYGKGSRTLSLPAVEHSVEVSLDGHATIRRRVTPRPGLPQQLEIALLDKEQARVAKLEPEYTNAAGQTMRLFHPERSDMASFSMGASRREPGRRSNETLRPVNLRRMFYLQTTEVSNAQFQQFQADHDSGHVRGNTLNKGQQPAVQLSWQQAASFCNWLSAREGLPAFYREDRGIIVGFDPAATGYRLPTEAEWAWAARARDTQWLRFPWGDTFPPGQVVENYADTTSAFITGRIINGYKDGYVVSAPLASFKPNQHGLHDMGGNVAEWVHDVFDIAAADSPAATDPLGAQRGDNYTIRGASWSMGRLPEIRLAYRDYGQAGRDDVGFRIARYAE